MSRASLRARIKYFNPKQIKLQKIQKGNWIDVRSASEEDILLKKGEYRLIPLGFALELPCGWEGHLAPRSGTYKNFKVIQTNSVGVVDDSFIGDNDQWHMPVYALEDTVIRFNERIGQFRLVEVMPELEFIEVDHFGNADRGGFSSTGVA